MIFKRMDSSNVITLKKVEVSDDAQLLKLPPKQRLKQLPSQQQKLPVMMILTILMMISIATLMKISTRLKPRNQLVVSQAVQLKPVQR